jgi:hypothetical protein
MNDGEVLDAPLPLYHIYALRFHCVAMMLIDGPGAVLNNPRECLQ